MLLWKSGLIILNLVSNFVVGCLDAFMLSVGTY